MRKRLGGAAPLAASLLVWLGSCAGHPAPVPAPAPPTPSVLALDAAVIHGTLSNGFTYFIRENGRPEDRALLWLQ